jgi:HD-GYP domain-containing protein (c-di-GMP phosphodiesterase class II)
MRSEKTKVSLITPEDSDGSDDSCGAAVLPLLSIAENAPEIQQKMMKKARLNKQTPGNHAMLMYRNYLSPVIAALEARDGYSGHHSERVALMTRRFSEVLGLLPVKAETMQLIAEVHDIGKVGIPDAVLNKPGKLDDDEWKIMQSHTVIGAGIIMKSSGEGIEEIAAAAMHHHERWDGHGYPDGLSGEDIPFSARIIALCDSTDAMLSDRVYRKALSEDVCKDELLKNSGKMYQPELAHAFVDHWDEIVGDLYAPYNQIAE